MFDDIKYLACSLPEGIMCYKYGGFFDEEIAAIDRLLASDDIIDAMREKLKLERLIALGMKEDYNIPFDEALAKMQKRIDGFTRDELIALMDNGAADWHLVRGEVYFLCSFYSSVMINTPELHSRLTDEKERARYIESGPTRNRNIEIMRERGKRGFHYRMSAWVKPDEQNERDGAHIVAHLPIPAPTANQTNIKIIKTDPPAYISNAEQRTVCFDTTYRAGMKFYVEYEYDRMDYYYDLDPKKVSAEQPSFDTCEQAPHIMFTPYMRYLADALAGDEKNPLLIARKFYDYITTKVKYSYMREYFELTNIPEFAALNGRADCGVQGLLFITLCRIKGIPAKWESGFCVHTDPMGVGSHDWAMFYVAPYGWLYCDPSYGGGAYRSKDLERWNHYFGNLDPFRMAANTNFQLEFDPPRKYTRIDPYDNQLGEVEYDDCGLSMWQISFERNLLEAKELD